MYLLEDMRALKEWGEGLEGDLDASVTHDAGTSRYQLVCEKSAFRAWATWAYEVDLFKGVGPIAFHLKLQEPLGRSFECTQFGQTSLDLFLRRHAKSLRGELRWVDVLLKSLGSMGFQVGPNKWGGMSAFPERFEVVRAFMEKHGLAVTRFRKDGPREIYEIDIPTDDVLVPTCTLILGCFGFRWTEPCLTWGGGESPLSRQLKYMRKVRALGEDFKKLAEIP